MNRTIAGIKRTREILKKVGPALLLVGAISGIGVVLPDDASAQKGIFYDQCMDSVNSWYLTCTADASWLERLGCAAQSAIKEWRCQEMLVLDAALEALLPYL